MSDNSFENRLERVREFHQRLRVTRLGETYEAAHARLILDFAEITAERRKLLQSDQLRRLPEPSQTAADKSYDETLVKLFDGLDSVLKSYERSSDVARKKMYQLWRHE